MSAWITRHARPCLPAPPGITTGVPFRQGGTRFNVSTCCEKTLCCLKCIALQLRSKLILLRRSIGPSSSEGGGRSRPKVQLRNRKFIKYWDGPLTKGPSNERIPRSKISLISDSAILLFNTQCFRHSHLERSGLIAVRIN